MNFDLIAFDADDTLWQGEVYYREAQKALTQLLTPWQNADEIHRVMFETEMRNLPLYGYGVKAFTLSMLEAAVAISHGAVTGKEIEAILTLGQGMLTAEIQLQPFVVETLTSLTGTLPLMVITKGDLLDQTAKVTRSGLAPFFQRVEVVNDKTTATYAEILQRYHLAPARFLMVGNSLRSDILPVLELGGTAVYIPADTSWAHEDVADFDADHQRFFELEHLGQLPGLLKTGFDS